MHLLETRNTAARRGFNQYSSTHTEPWYWYANSYSYLLNAHPQQQLQLLNASPPIIRALAWSAHLISLFCKQMLDKRMDEILRLPCSEIFDTDTLIIARCWEEQTRLLWYLGWKVCSQGVRSHPDFIQVKSIIDKVSALATQVDYMATRRQWGHTHIKVLTHSKH